MEGASATDKEKLLKIFPNEVWEMIFGEVKDVPNYHRISNASPHFRSLLLPRAPQILFPEVAERLVERYIRVRKSLPMRQVCRSWRQGMDQMLQTAKVYSKGEEEEDFGYGCHAIGGYSFEKAEDFTDFELHFDPTHHLAETVNPFLTRGVDLEIEYEDGLGLVPLEPYYTACERVLQKYGHHVWYLFIDLGADYLDGVVDFNRRRLPAILQLLPNIQVLTIFCDDSHEQYPSAWENVEQQPFPNLPQLKWICMPETPTFVVRELVMSNLQIQGVQTGAYPELLQIYLEVLPSLTHLQFTCCNPEDFEVFSSIRVSGQIETLWMDMFVGQVPWEEIFYALESQFSETLTELRLRLPSFFKENLNEAPELSLPNLKRLTLSMCGSAWPLDFLLPMTSTLEYIRVELWFGEEEGKDTVIEKAQELEKVDGVKLYGCWRALAKSSAWSKFPKLQLLQTAVYRRGEERDTRDERHSCTRDQWERAQIDLQ